MANNTKTPDNTRKTETTDGYVDLFVDMGYQNDDPNEFISINGKNYILPKGQTSRVPVCVKKEYERSRRAFAVQRKNAATLLEKARGSVKK